MLHAHRGWRWPVALLLALVPLFAVPLAGGAAPSGKARLAGSVPPWATAANFKQAAGGADSVGFEVYLSWQHPDALAGLIHDLSTPGSPRYGQYLTPQQFRQQFAPSPAQVNAVRHFLTSNGFSIVDVPLNGLYVKAEGTVAQAEQAFGAALNVYSVDGLDVRAPAGELQVPASLSGIVAGVVGLDDSAAFVHPDHVVSDAPPPATIVQPGPCSNYWAQQTSTAFTNPYDPGTALPWIVCGYTPSQLQGAYGTAGLIAQGIDGSGQTVAIIDAYASPTIVEDANAFSAAYGLPRLTGANFQQVVAPGTYHHPERGQKQDPQGWYGEETLDVEAVHAMAPGAKIVFIGAPNNFQDLDAAMNHAVDRHLANIITNSYGFATELLPPGFIIPQEQIFMQAAAEGIGVYFSSGDTGDESPLFGFATPDWPAVSPFVTAVGGTTLGVGQANSYLFEVAWGTHTTTWDGTKWSPAAPGPFIYGGGGGVSRLFARPAYQAGVVPSSITTRAIPDVAMNGDPQTGFPVWESTTNPDGTVVISVTRFGGTSLSSPLFAGMMALADQAAGHPHGFANPALYA
ncbi:MAG TPA: S53 family peptidase, partial [Thermomicrobiales bacterium]|nr:S53 family peptidase [Thermomicrobiales bacterium]